MSDETNYTVWRDDTLEWICCNSKVIKQVAKDWGVPAEAIAGIMAKENDWYRRDTAPWLQKDADAYAYAMTLWPTVTHEYWSNESK